MEEGTTILNQNFVEKFDALKQLYDILEEVRLKKGLLLPVPQIVKRKNKDSPVVWNWPFEVNCRELSQFVQRLEEDGWIVQDYSPEEGGKALNNFDEIRNADLQKIRRLFTYFVRGERFGDGFWADLVESGFVKALIERIEEIILTDKKFGHRIMERVFIPATHPEDWRKLLADPEKQWKKGFSARALAYCWQEANDLPKDVKKVLTQIPELKEIEALIIIPEHKVPLPPGEVSPSQSDCWVLARTSEHLISIAVEGKVAETFGTTIDEWFSNPSKGKKERLSYLCSQVGIDNPPPGNIRYQLLHRTASAIIEAKRFHAKYAIMLVHSFSQTAEWFDDYKEFVELFGAEAKLNKIISAGKRSGVNLYFAWVCGDKRYLEL